ncbi:hypothetical protein SBADM41S_06223 [Streptomyces badius]
MGGPDDCYGVVWSEPRLDPEGAAAATAPQIAHRDGLGHEAAERKLNSHDGPADLAEPAAAAVFAAEAVRERRRSPRSSR